jgi:hypothetical protein
MGVDYDGVGGIGIEVTDELVEKLIESGAFSQDEWEDDYYGTLEEVAAGQPCYVAEAGSRCYGGERRLYLMVPGSSLQEVMDNETPFIAMLHNLGVMVGRQDLKVISDLRVW